MSLMEDWVPFSWHCVNCGNIITGYKNSRGDIKVECRRCQTVMVRTLKTPNHFHWYKTEDIINRGGGNILIRVYNSLPDESIDKESDVTVHCDGRTYTVPAGTQVKLTPGESIHIQQYMYHDFEVEPGTGAVLLGEVSQCNDDNTDNRFNPPVGRFPKIEEDEVPYRLLCNEYPAAK